LNQHFARTSQQCVARLLLLFTLAASSWATAEPLAYIAIIIDDLGHSKKQGEAFIEIPAPLTFAILPHTAHSQSIATSAHAAQKEVMIHLPMANLQNIPIGPGGLRASLPRSEFLLALDAAIADVPFAKGINNHTGSYLTQRREEMSWLMTEMKKQELFFIDSRTTEKSVAGEVAREHAVISSSRDVFLDNQRREADIDAAFQKLVAKAKVQGTAIGIGHPYPETLSYLAKTIPTLEAEGIRVLPASSLIAKQQQGSETTRVAANTAQ
jgi:hypothetical protein